MSDAWQREVDEAVAQHTGRRGEFDRDGTDELGAALTHRALAVPGEIHLGPLEECRHCRPHRRRRT